MWFGNLKDLVNSKFIYVSSALMSVDKTSKLNLVLNILEEGEELQMELETQSIMLGISKRILEEGKQDWQPHLGKLQGSTSSFS